MNEDLTKNFNFELQHRERLNNIVTAIKNYKQWTYADNSGIDKLMRQCYDDVLNIIEKETTLSLPCDFTVENHIKRRKNEIVDSILEIDKYKGSDEYLKMVKIARAVADKLESIMFECFELGRNNGLQER